MRRTIVLTGNTMASYPQGGGHWSVFLQYLLGLQLLGHDFLWLELLKSRGSRSRDERLIRLFIARFNHIGLGDNCAMGLYDRSCGTPSFDDLEIHNFDKVRLRRIIGNADVLWNFHCAMRQPLLGLFSRRALLDLDPGHLQVSALHWDMEILEHDVVLTVGTNIKGVDCETPTLEQEWHPFLPPMFLPFWSTTYEPHPNAPFTSITQWNWGEAEEMWLGDRSLSVGKRDAYMRYLKLPLLTEIPLELAANIDTEDRTGDLDLLRANGWSLVRPHQVARTPALYRTYISKSRGEFGCAKPIYAELRTGWFSDRSAAYLAMHRPVVIEDTGMPSWIQDSPGILTFRTLDEARDRLLECVANYGEHVAGAAAFAKEHLDSSKVLTRLINISLP